MPGTLQKAFGYQDDQMNLPVANVAAALPYYETVFGFRVVSRGTTPHASAILARDAVQIGLVESGGDPTNDGCAFHVQGLAALLEEFNSRGFGKDSSAIDTEEMDGEVWNVFYAIAPDGLCYWFGERKG